MIMESGQANAYIHLHYSTPDAQISPFNMV
jgi:hypothetical protein